MSVIFLIISITLTVFLPIVSLMINLVNFVLIKKERKIYAFLLALSLGLIAYIWEPTITSDLYRHQLEMKSFYYSGFSAVIARINTELEPLNYIIKYIIAKTNNYNLLQAFISFVGYFEILWIISDYSKKKETKLSAVAIITIFIILSLKYISFISGLWFNISIINFALGVYLEYTKKAKQIHWIFYIIAISLHISTVYLLILLLAVKLSKSINLKKITITAFIVSLLLGPMITLLNKHIDLYFIHYIYKLYNSYFIMGDRFDYLHSGTNLIFSILRLIITLIIIYKEKENLKKYNKKYVMLILITSASISAILFSAKIYIRFIYFVQLISIPILLDYFSKKLDKQQLAISITVILFCGTLLIPQYNQMKANKLFKCIEHNLSHNIFNLENGGSE